MAKLDKDRRERIERLLRDEEVIDSCNGIAEAMRYIEESLLTTEKATEVARAFAALGEADRG